MERTGERFYAAELLRQKGELVLAAGGERGAAARCFATAVHIARHQRALALERRALRSLATLSDGPHEDASCPAYRGPCHDGLNGARESRPETSNPASD